MKSMQAFLILLSCAFAVPTVAQEVNKRPHHIQKINADQKIHLTPYHAPKEYSWNLKDGGLDDWDDDEDLYDLTLNKTTPEEINSQTNSPSVPVASNMSTIGIVILILAVVTLISGLALIVTRRIRHGKRKEREMEKFKDGEIDLSNDYIQQALVLDDDQED